MTNLPRVYVRIQRFVNLLERSWFWDSLSARKITQRSAYIQLSRRMNEFLIVSPHHYERKFFVYPFTNVRNISSFKCRFQRYPEIINKAFSKNWSESTTEGLLLLRENGLVNGINLARIRSGRMEEEDKKIHAGWVTRKFCTIISNRRISRLIGTDSSFHWNYLYVKTVVTVVRHCCPWLICYPIIRELFLFTNIL